jgi:hypothetical protein
MDQRARGAGAHLALVEGEHHEALDRLVQKLVVGGSHVRQEDVRALAAQLECDRDDVLAGVLHDQPAGGGLPGERHLRHPRTGGQRLAGLHAEAVDHVEHPPRQQVRDQLDHLEDRRGRLLGRLEHHAVAGRERRAKPTTLPVAPGFA